MPQANVLVVDDEQNIRRTIKGILEDEGFCVEGCASAEEGMVKIDGNRFVLLLLDVRLPGMDGIAFLEELSKRERKPSVIVMSGHATIDMAVQATKLGAFDFLEKPIDPERLLLTIRHALEIRGLREENRALRQAGSAATEMVGGSAAMEELRADVAKAAPSNSRVLICGENGTGKELVARAIHEESNRRDHPFIKVNCAAIPKDLIESELFGHERGSFTGASDQRIGKIEQADRGTLLLDEVGDMALETQAKLLRVLEARELERVGGRRTIPFDVRVLSATNKDLKEEIAGGRFREDLYYRLAVIPITVPPLRERALDIPSLIEHFSNLFAEESGRKPKKFSEEAVAVLRAHDWPGNIRELKNLAERLQIMSEGDEIGSGEVSRVFRGERAASQEAGVASFRRRVAQFEMQVITEALRRNRGNVAETARELMTDRANLHRKMKRYGINAKDPS